MPSREKKDCPVNRTTMLLLTAPGWVDVVVRDDEGEPLPRVAYTLELADGEVVEGELDGDGRAREEEVLRGVCRLAIEWSLEETPRRLKQLRFRLEDEDGTVFTRTRYELEVGGKTLAGRTDGEGRIVEHVPAEAPSGTLTFWSDQVEGEEEEYSFELTLR